MNKSIALEMSFGKACHILRQEILFHLLKELNKNICYRCGKIIENRSELTIDHKTDWLHSETPQQLFFDMRNIAFSHAFCNTSAQNHKRQNAITIGATGFRGVSYAKWAKRYVTRVSIDGKERPKFYFKTAQEAAEKYDEEAIKIYGDKAITNKSLGLLNG